MKLSPLHNALARGMFAMDPQRAASYMPRVLSILTGQDTGVYPIEKPKSETAHRPGWNDYGYIRPYTINSNTGEKRLAYVKWIEETDTVEWGFHDVQKGSVAVLPIADVIMKYDFCGSYGTITMCDILSKAIAHPNILGVVLDMDTPGGEVYGTKTLADMVANSPKPVVAYVNEGYAASGGYYIIAGADRILMQQPTDMVGSIGVYTTLIDSTGAYEKSGYKLLTIYSPTSPEKNEEWNEAMKNGNVKPMQKQLAYLDKVFMDHVKAGRPKLDTKALEGGMFFTDEAISMGLADGYATYQQAIETVINLSRGGSLSFSS